MNPTDLIPVRRDILASCAAEIRNLRAKLGAGEQEGWEGTLRRDRLLAILDNAVPASAVPARDLASLHLLYARR